MLKRNSKYFKVNRTLTGLDKNGDYDWSPSFSFKGIIECTGDCYFESKIKDWNNDGYEYPMECCWFKGRYGLEMVTKESFNHYYADYIQEEPIKKYTLKEDTSNNPTEYTKVRDFTLYKEKLVLLETKSYNAFSNEPDREIVTEEEFLENYTQVY